MGKSVLKLLSFAALTVGVTAMAASAQVTGGPTPGGIGLQEAATENAETVTWLYNGTMILMAAIVALVLGLLIYIMIRFREKANPVPSKTSHNTLLEVVWTAVPVIIVLALIAVATKPLYDQDVIPDTEMTIKVVGNQWNWTYSYPDHGDFDYVSVMLPEDVAADRGVPYLLAVDEPLVVPVNTKIEVLVTASDVLHSFAMPSFAVKMDAVPGRINHTWFEVLEEGTYYGQCSEICGREHAYMPIEIRVVSQSEFISWVKSKNPEYVQAPAVTQEAALDSATATQN